MKEYFGKTAGIRKEDRSKGLYRERKTLIRPSSGPYLSVQPDHLPYPGIRMLVRRTAVGNRVSSSNDMCH